MKPMLMAPNVPYITMTEMGIELLSPLIPPTVHSEPDEFVSLKIAPATLQRLIAANQLTLEELRELSPECKKWVKRALLDNLKDAIR